MADTDELTSRGVGCDSSLIIVIGSSTHAVALAERRPRLGTLARSGIPPSTS
ncbi:hypothetical protein [Streptomyces sp. NPDC001828]|uniref:hypothetical protein n=1 Tax=Streptomyces sp. NPDC001828 TaxID=3364615 RepID=UPI00369AABCF